MDLEHENKVLDEAIRIAKAGISDARSAEWHKRYLLGQLVGLEAERIRLNTVLPSTVPGELK